MDFDSTDLIGLGPRGHVRALERLWLLYVSPSRFREWLEKQPVGRQLVQELFLWAHVVPYWILIITHLTNRFDNAHSIQSDSFLRFAFLVLGVCGIGAALQLIQSIASLLAILRNRIREQVAIGVTHALISSFGALSLIVVARFWHRAFGSYCPHSVVYLIAITQGVMTGLIGRIATLVSEGIDRDGRFSSALGSTFIVLGCGLMSSSAVLYFGEMEPYSIGFFTCINWLMIGVSIGLMRAYYYGFHVVFWLTRSLCRGDILRWHPIAWDGNSQLPYFSMDKMLVRFFEASPVSGNVLIERLMTYSSHRISAQKARCRIIARQSGRVTLLGELSSLIKQLPEGNEKYLAQVPDIVARVIAIVTEDAELRRLPLNMPAFRVAQAERVCEAITQFRDQIAGFAEPLSSEFREAALHWLKLAETQLGEERRAADREPFPSVFRAGDPVAGEKAEAFLPRTRVVEELIQLVLATNGCPGILLYARRRMGKSTCLQNLMGFIPSNVEVVFLNLQSAQTSGSTALFCEHVREAIARTLTHRGCNGLSPSPRYSGERVGVRGHFNQAEDHSDDGTLLECPSPPAPLPGVPGREEQGGAWVRDSRDVSSLLADFERFLDEANRHYEQAGRRLLIALDEYEYLDRKLGERDEDGRPLISEDLLGLLRTSIQTHRHLIWLFSGSHRITELKHAEWPSYFISLRTVELDRFTLAETSQLLTDPVKYSRLFQGEKAAKRPQFPPEFWGHNGLQRLHEAADGWPHLVVLLAETCVNLANQRNVPDISDELWIDVRHRAIESGENVMIQLLKNESEIPGEWEYLLGFRDLPDHAPLAEPDNPAVKKSLQRRSLVEFENGQACMRVPLMQQWLRERSHWLD